MGNNISEKIVEWAKLGGDFESGISLFLTYNRNIYYSRVMMLKGEKRGMVALVSEFSRKIGMPLKELTGIIGNARVERSFSTDNGHRVAETGIPIVVNQREKEIEKRKVKLREEFPFLGNKDCPDELAVLVNKMITAFYDYRTGHEGLYEINTNDLQACYQGAREVLDAYILNRDIWDELEYYKLYGKIRGWLPELQNRDLSEDFRGMSTINLVKLMENNIPRKLSYYKQQLASEKTKNKDDIRDKMARRELELSIIKGILRDRGEM